jgi:hypothetical protein
MAVLAMALAVPGIAEAAAPANDAYTSAELLTETLDIDFQPTDEATAAGEPLATGSGFGCDGNEMGNTVWYKVSRATSGPISINTLGSDFDTIVVIYDTNGGAPSNANFLACSDDAASLGQTTSRLTFSAVAGKTYLIQAGGYDVPGVTPAESGNLQIVRANSPPDNDDRIDAEELTAGDTIDRDNLGATEESSPPEDPTCDDDPANPRLGSTVWFTYTVPAPGGTLTFNSTAFDTVMQVYKGDATNPFKCNDDGGSLNSRVSFDADPGVYYVQVGGFAGVQGFFNLGTEFTPRPDSDNDGSVDSADCDDGNAGIHPGANDVPENGVDEDCSGADAVNFDRDGDGFNRPQDCDDTKSGVNPSATDIADNGVDEDCNGSDAVNLDRDGDGFPRPRDCNDNRRGIHPGAHDTPGDGIDQDCSGSDARAALLEWDYNYFLTPGSKVSTLNVKAARGSRVRMSCRGSGCPGGKSLRSKGKRLNFARYFKGTLGDGARIELRAVKSGFIGRVVRITNRKGKKPTKKDLCLPPGKSKPRKKCR